MRSYILKTMMRIGVAALVLAVGTIPAQAIPITVHFAAAFPAPTNPVTGTFVYDAASTTANINSLTSIDLTIEGHTYSLSEVGFVTGLDISSSPFNPPSVLGQNIGGTTGGGVTSIGPNAYPDFWLLWDQTGLVGLQFIYSTVVLGVVPGGVVHLTNSFSQFSVTASSAAVPEPTTMFLIGSGLISLWGARKKLKK